MKFLLSIMKKVNVINRILKQKIVIKTKKRLKKVNSKTDKYNFKNENIF